MTPVPANAAAWITCPHDTCRGKRAYMSKRSAKHVAKITQYGTHVYRCPNDDHYWHLGHLPRDGQRITARMLAGMPT